MRKSSRTLLAFALVIPALVLVVAVSMFGPCARQRVDGPTERAAASADSASAEPTTSETISMLVPPSDDSAPFAEAAARVDAPLDHATERTPVASVRRLHGALIMTDGSDLERLPPGELTLDLLHEVSTAARSTLPKWRADVRKTSVVHGEWEVDVGEVAPSFAVVRSLLFGARPALIDGGRSPLPLPADGFLEIRARLAPHTMLRVLDAETRADLTAITIVAAPRGTWFQQQHPGADDDSRTIARELRSPVDLDDVGLASGSGRPSTLFVGAEGRAWARLEARFPSERELEVVLARGGDLDVTIGGVTAPSVTMLRVRPFSSSSPTCELALAEDGIVHLRGLLPGKVRVTAEIGERDAHPIELAGANARLVAGTTSAITLALRPAPRAQPSNISGTIAIPSAWGIANPVLHAKLLDTPLAGFRKQRVTQPQRSALPRSGFEVFAWYFDDVQAGKYELSFESSDLTALVDAPPGEKHDFALELPSPCDLSVRIVDVDTGEAVEVDELLWQRNDEAQRGTLRVAKRDTTTGLFALRTAGGKIALSVRDARFEASTTSLDLASGVHEITIRLSRACGVVVRLRDGRTAVGWPEDGALEPVAVGGTTGRLRSMSRSPIERRLQLTAPGTYTLTLPKITGYRDVPVQTVVVPPREFVEHVVQLERERR